MFAKDLLEGQRILVTGGGSGLGREMATKYAELGATVYVCGRRQSVVDETAAEISAATGGTAIAYPCDIRDPNSVGQLMDFVWEAGPLTGLVNNAAGNFIARTQDLSVNGFNAVSDIVFRGTFYVTQAVGRRWIDAGNPGSVLSIIATFTQTGSPFIVPSAMSKAGIEAMTRSLAIEWGRYGIRLNAVSPGVFPTEGATARLRPGDELHERERLENPMGRLGKMSELQNLAAFLMAPGCEWLTGQTIAVDGAHHLANGAYYTDCLAWTDAQWQEAREKVRSQDARDRQKR